MKKMLFLTSELPWPLHSGGKLKTFKLLESLASKYDVTLVCPLKGEDEQYLNEFCRLSPCRIHLHEPVDRARNATNLVKSYIAGVPLNVLRSYSEQLASRTRKIAAHFDVIFLDHYELHYYIPQSQFGKVIYHAHNTYHKIWQTYAATPGNILFRAAAWLEFKRVKTCEKRLCKKVRLVLAAPGDIEILSQGLSGSVPFHPTYHLGNSSQLTMPDLAFDRSKHKLVYVGFLGWEPNSAGLLWFIERVWPRLVNVFPELTFDIVGKNPDQRLSSAVAQHRGITLCGFVEDLETVYQQGSVSVAPLLFGSGMKVKVLDAMSRGLPVATTSIGAESIACDHGEHLMIGDTPELMTENITQLLRDEGLWNRLQLSSRQLIREHYTWESMFSEMHRVIDCLDICVTDRRSSDVMLQLSLVGER